MKKVHFEDVAQFASKMETKFKETLILAFEVSNHAIMPFITRAAIALFFHFCFTVASTGVVFATSEQIAQTDLQQQSNTPTMKALASKQTCLKYFGNALRSKHTIQNTFYLYYLPTYIYVLTYYAF